MICILWKLELVMVKSLVGKKFGRLLVVSICGTDKNRLITYNCICNCGNKKVATSRSLTDNRVKSCGCLKLEMYHVKKISHRFIKLEV